MTVDDFGAGSSPAQFDFARLASISSGDAEFEREISGEYLAQSRQLLVQMAQAIASGDVATLRRAAHTLKGSSRTIGAEGLGAISAELERKGGPESPAATTANLARVEAGLAATERALDDYFGTDAYRKAA